MKTCTKCLLSKPLSDFGKGRYRCKPCTAEDAKAYHQNNRDKNLLYSASYLKNNGELLREKRRVWYHKNKERIRAEKNERALKCRDQTNEKYRIKYRDPLIGFALKIRPLIRSIYKKRKWKQEGSTTDILGCDFHFLRKHLQNTAILNYGEFDQNLTYHIDHIIPISIAKNLEQALRLNHYSNLQLLKPEDNLKKSNKIPENIDLSYYL